MTALETASVTVAAAYLDWDLAALLKAGNVVGARRAQVLALAARDPAPVATAYVSWRLKAVSQPKLILPGVWAASQVLTYEGTGAGDLHDAYARLGPVVMAYLLHWARATRTENTFALYDVADAARREKLSKQLAKFWGLYRRLWPVDLGLSALVERVTVLGIDVNITKVQVNAVGDFYLAQQMDGQMMYQLVGGE